MRKQIVFLFLLVSNWAQAQSIIVPTNLYFADQHFILEESGRRDLQMKVDALLKYPKYFQLKVDLADTYFPIIERVFREEGLPDDFKYLALIESGLVQDAVSTSNAVGFWQFKKDTATDYGLRINQDVDERKHITESSRSAARYLVKSNTLYYKNWHNTILSYYHGFTGAKALAQPNHINKKEMVITDKTDNYILKLLAHKIAYGSAVGLNPAPLVMLREVPASGKNISDIALENQVDEAEIKLYNKWLASQYIPNDKNYTVLIPVTNPEQRLILASQRTPATPIASASETPEIVTERNGKHEVKKLNGLKVIIAQQGDSKDKLARRAHLSTRKLLAYNDMRSFDPIETGEAYYIERKKSKAAVQYHVVKEGERVQQISQRYGVKAHTILWNNRLKNQEVLVAGRLLWMQHRRPGNVPVEYKSNPDSEPTRAPANPVILAKDEVLDEVNANKSTASSQTPDPSKKPVKDYPGGKLSGTQPVPPHPAAPAIAETEVADDSTTEAETEAVAAVSEKLPETEVITADKVKVEAALDTALASTNEQEEYSEEVLSENIDNEIETINQTPAPAVLYKKSAPTGTVAATKDTAVTQTKSAWTKGDSTSTQEKPVIVLKEPLDAPQKAPSKVVPKEQAAPKETSTSKETSNSKVATTIKTPTAPVLKEPAYAPAQAATPGIHVVAKGETLYSISKQYNTTPDNLKFWNNLSDNMPLAIGQNLKVTAPAVKLSDIPVAPASTAMLEASPAKPVHNSKAGASANHTVIAGESMYQISRKYGVTIKDIMDWNHKSDFNVRPGEILVIKAVGNSRY